jgi:hypothetical protein
MDRTRLRPAADDLLTSDPHLPEMMPYVQNLVEGPEAEVVARNAALAYLALITARRVFCKSIGRRGCL